MTDAAQILIDADGSLTLRLQGEPVAHVPATQADWVRRLIDSADGMRAKRLIVTGIVAGIAVSEGGGRTV